MPDDGKSLQILLTALRITEYTDALARAKHEARGMRAVQAKHMAPTCRPRIALQSQPAQHTVRLGP